MIQEKDQIWDAQIPPQPSGHSPSTSEEKLTQYLQNSDLKSLQDFAALKREMLSLLPSDITHRHSGKFVENIAIKIIRHTKNFDLVDVQVRLGHFTFAKVSIMSVDEVSPLHGLCFDSFGNFGNVFTLRHKGLGLAFKCFGKAASPQEQRRQPKGKNLLKRVIEEYCILRLASCLGVGPRLYGEVGCDIVVYKNCIEFGMELCSNSTAKSNNLQLLAKNLRQNLARLHCLQIVHSDLKAQNICFSNQTQRYVFIDYGFSSIINEKIGLKTKSRCKGSFNHISDEMLKLFNEQDQAYIDLYYNDYHCLKLIINDLKYVGSMFYLESEDEGEQAKAAPPQIAEQLSLNSLKQSLFNLRFSVVSKQIGLLSDVSYIKLSLFTQNLPFRSKTHKIQRMLSTRTQSIEEGEPSLALLEQESKGQPQSSYFLSSVIEQQSAEYYLHDYERNSGELIDLLSDSTKAAGIAEEEYFLLLAKATELNSSKLTLEQLNSVCRTAIEGGRVSVVSEQQKSNQDQGQDEDQEWEWGRGRAQCPHLRSVSRALFRRSLQRQLSSHYFEVFLWTATNVVVLGALRNAEILKSFEQLLEMVLDFAKKVTALLRLNSTVACLSIISPSQSKYERLLFKMGRIVDRHTANLNDSYTKQQRQILTFALRVEILNKENDQIPTAQQLKKIVGRRLSLELMRWKCFKQFFHYEYKEQGVMVENLTYYSEELSFGSYYVCEFYHFCLLLYYLSSMQLKHLVKTISKVKSGFKFDETKIGPFFQIINAIILLRKANYHFKQIELFLSNQLIHNNKITVLNPQILRQLTEIRFRFQSQLSLCSFKHQKQLFLLQSYTRHKRTYIINNNTQQRYACLLNVILYQRRIQDEYYNRFYQTIDNQMFFECQDYCEQRKKTQILLQKVETSKRNRIISLQIICLMMMLVKAQRQQMALQVGNYLYRASFRSKDQKLSKLYTMQVIIIYIINRIFLRINPAIKQEKRQFFFQYAELVCQLQCEETLLNIVGIFIDVLSLMLKYAVHKVLPLVNRISEKLYLFNSKDNTERLITTVNVIFKDYFYQKWFLEANIKLIEDEQLWANPYNLILAFKICQFLKRNLRSVHLSKLVKLFKCLRYCNPIVHQIYKEKMLLLYLHRFQKGLKPRKLMSIYKKLVKFNNPSEIRIRSSDLMKLFVDKKSKRELRRDPKKLRKICNKLKSQNTKLSNDSRNSRFELICSYNRIWDIIQRRVA